MTQRPKPITDNGQPTTTERILILRHDVDARKKNSLAFARIQQSMGITGTYYFRVNQQSFDETAIREIASQGHEIGYHYETMDTCQGDVNKAYQEFCRNLEMFRRIVPIETICMHGSPLSQYENRSIWEKYDYRKLGLIAEPYIDLDFHEVAYYTDTGRRWDGEKVSVRDRSITDNQQQITANWPRYHSTLDIIKAIQYATFPTRTMMTFHPQRWTDQPAPWVQELLTQNVKNTVKYWVIKLR